MSQQAWEPKYGDEVIDYEADWTEALNGDEIEGEVTGQVFGTVTGEDAMTVENISTVDGISRVWISGGGARASLSPRVHLTANTAGGRTLSASIRLPVLGR